MAFNPEVWLAENTDDMSVQETLDYKSLKSRPDSDVRKMDVEYVPHIRALSWLRSQLTVSQLKFMLFLPENDMKAIIDYEISNI
jgi:hypothetical protein